MWNGQADSVQKGSGISPRHSWGKYNDIDQCHQSVIKWVNLSCAVTKCINGLLGQLKSSTPQKPNYLNNIEKKWSRLIY